MPGVRPVDAFGEQTLATALAPSREGGASALGPHACAKSMLSFAGTFGALESAFHINIRTAKDRRRAMLGSREGLSMECTRESHLPEAQVSGIRKYGE